MIYMTFNGESTEKVTPDMIKNANQLINTSEGKQVTIDLLLRCIDGLRIHPDVFLDQLYLSIEAERKKSTDWESREGMRGALKMLKVIKEMRTVMKRMIPEIGICETEEEEKQLMETTT